MPFFGDTNFKNKDTLLVPTLWNATCTLREWRLPLDLESRTRYVIKILHDYIVNWGDYIGTDLPFT